MSARPGCCHGQPATNDYAQPAELRDVRYLSESTLTSRRTIRHSRKRMAAMAVTENCSLRIARTPPKRGATIKIHTHVDSTLPRLSPGERTSQFASKKKMGASRIKSYAL